MGISSICLFYFQASHSDFDVWVGLKPVPDVGDCFDRACAEEHYQWNSGASYQHFGALAISDNDLNDACVRLRKKGGKLMLWDIECEKEYIHLCQEGTPTCDVLGDIIVC